MLDRLRNLFSVNGKPAFSESQIHPENPIYAIGDIHGCAGLLADMLALIETDIIENQVRAPVRVFLGDYIDRGEQSADVLKRLQAIAENDPDKVVCLLGNHEMMLLDFLDDPQTNGQRWLRNGGLQTLASFQIGGVGENSDAEQMKRARDKLQLAMPDGCEQWLRGLPVYWKSGNVVCAHAGMDPDRDVDHQDVAACIWGQSRFLKAQRTDGNWVIHGHTPVERAGANNGRIAIDTGAYYSRRLSTAVLRTGGIRFLTT